MAITPRVTRQVQRDVAPINPLAGAAAGELRRELEDFSARRSATLDQRAAAAGFLEGQQAGEGGEFEGRENTVRGRAFARGVIVAHQAAVQTDVRDSVAQFELDHANDPDGFDAKVAALREGLAEETPGELRPFVEQRINDYAGRAKINIIATQQAELEAEALDDLNRGVEGFLEDAGTAAFEGDPLLVEARRQELGALMAEGVTAEFLDEDDAADVAKQFERSVTANEVIGNFDRLVRAKGQEAGAESIKRWQDTKPSSVGLTPEEHEAVTRRLVALRNRQDGLESDERAKATAAAKAEKKARTDRVRDSIKVMESGFSLEPGDDEQATADLSALDDPDLAADFDVAQAIQSQVHAFRRAPPLARDQALTELEQSLRVDGANVDQVALLKALRATHNDVTRQVEQDPRGFVNREGLVDDVPLNFENGENLVESIAGRVEAGADVGEALTGEPLPLLTAGEATQLAQVYGQAEIEERIGILGGVTAGAGEEAMATLGQLDATGNRRMALLGSYVMTGQQELARSVMRGDMLLASDKGIQPKRVDYQATLDDEIGAAMADWPAERQQYVEAAFARYADLKARSGDVSDLYNDNLFEQAVNEVLPTARFNSRRVALPPGVTEDRFDEWTEGWTAETFSQPPQVTPETEALVAHGQRNLRTGQGFDNHSILSGSVEDSRLNGGRPTVIPFVYEGAKVSVTEAIDRAVESGIEWPSADTNEQATEISKAASTLMDQFDAEGNVGIPGATAEELLEQVQNRGRLVELGGNEYGVSLDSALTGEAKLLVDANRQPLVLRFPQDPQ